ncbi:2-C-methyl-D-erythritol 4-phosphate cytidylyltransferase [bacterium]|nr:2-C-methyl-D-erythritol 4-phosphate cytidylyltransferase [bacterium]
MKNIVVLLCAGVGLRFDKTIKKQLYLINKTPLFIICLKQFLKFKNLIDKLCLVINKNDQEIIKNILIKYGYIDDITLIIGEDSRSKSLLNAIIYLNKTYKEQIKVISHDIARCFIPLKIIKEHLETKINENEVINTLMNLNDSILKISNNKIQTLNRKNYYLIQTPQTFINNKIYQAINNNYQEYLKYTDLCSFAIDMNFKMKQIEGSILNIKITNKDDIDLLSLIKD